MLQFVAVIGRKDDGYVSLWPELDIASQGETVDEARQNLVEALELFLEVASRSEISRRLGYSAEASNYVIPASAGMTDYPISVYLPLSWSIFIQKDKLS